jgi:hypothetical protein
MTARLRSQRSQYLASRISFDRHLYPIRALSNCPSTFFRFPCELIFHLASLHDLSTRDSLSLFRLLLTSRICMSTRNADIWQTAYSVQQLRSRRPVLRELEVLLRNEARGEQGNRCSLATHHYRDSFIQGELHLDDASLNLPNYGLLSLVVDQVHIAVLHPFTLS